MSMFSRGVWKYIWSSFRTVCYCNYP